MSNSASRASNPAAASVEALSRWRPRHEAVPATDRPFAAPAKLMAALLSMAWAVGLPFVGGRAAAAQQALLPPKDQGDIYDTRLMPMRAAPLDRSLPELVAGGWRVVAVTVSGRIFQYHLVGEDSLAICFVDTQGAAPASECIRLAPVPR